ncbi:poly-gamma-glutamate biosynthesis isoform B [Micractinium conductrix]|uniref:Poly-gamma-glutamate biosynthesis isoform B n=1 Tax=Micractinium conductrix TaxID=554055 RepID=A0A2P6V5T0_9CHLO|nr:poly-gamma-glutamate biosynthesis isoform B [Micractinium conductrix]|eukprot:PSC69444.1 poly-gamma-glutamate biosynthesis isoform B [Micractinium conductrix]
MSGGVALVLLGDVMLGRVVDEALTVLRPAQHMHRVWGDCLPLLRGGMAATGEQQLVAGNLECAVTDAEEKEEKEFNFKLSPANVDALTTARFDFASLANNHSLDYKEQGLHETRRVLAAAGIAAAGAGTAGEAAAPALVERGGCKLAFFCYSDHYETWAATERRPGINYIRPETATPEAVAAQLAAAQAAGADLTVVFVHWGPNWRWRPSKAIQRLARTFVDCGASIVFGHSSHHIKLHAMLRSSLPLCCVTHEAVVCL